MEAAFLAAALWTQIISFPRYVPIIKSKLVPLMIPVRGGLIAARPILLRLGMAVVKTAFFNIPYL